MMMIRIVIDIGGKLVKTEQRFWKIWIALFFTFGIVALLLKLKPEYMYSFIMGAIGVSTLSILKIQGERK